MVLEGVRVGGSMDVIFRSLESVRISVLSGVRVEVGRREESMGLEELIVGILTPGSRDCVLNVRLVSTLESWTRMLEQIDSMISSSLRKLTSRFVGWTLTSTRWGSISMLR